MPRRVEPGDAPAATELLNAYSRRLYGEGELTAAEVEHWWGGRGPGSVLLRPSFRQFYRRRRRIVELGVDAENVTGAVRLYERAGMHVSGRADMLEMRL